MRNRDPFKLFTDEVKNSYLRCSYKWCFHHIPTLLDKVRKGTLEASLIWAILALAIRYVLLIHMFSCNRSWEWLANRDLGIDLRVILHHPLERRWKRVTPLQRMRDRSFYRIWNNPPSAVYKPSS
jgi:hypothetical protein